MARSIKIKAINFEPMVKETDNMNLIQRQQKIKRNEKH